MNFILVGCGKIARTYLEAFKSLPEVCLKGVVDISEEVSRSTAGQAGCRSFTDLRSVLRGNSLEAAIICTPSNTHAEIAKFFLENGVHVLCEKPLAINSAQALEMLKKAKSHKRLLMMTSKFRYVEDLIAAKEIIDSGEIGKLIYFKNFFQSKVNMKNRWYSSKKVAGGGVLIDYGSHSVDIVRYLLGPVIKVKAELTNQVQKLEVEDNAILHLRTKYHTFCTAELSWSLNGNSDSYIETIGRKGMLSVGWKSSRYRKLGEKKWLVFGRGYNELEAFIRQLKNFIAATRDEEEPLITFEESLDSVRVIEAAYESLSKNRWVKIEPSSSFSNDDSWKIIS